MVSKFYKNRQLGTTQLSQGGTTNLTGVDEAANTRAKQTELYIDQLNGIGNSVLNAATGVANEYTKNIDSKLAIQSRSELATYENTVNDAISNIQDIDSKTDGELKAKLQEINSAFMDEYKDAPFRSKLRSDIDLLQKNVMTKLYSGRDTMYSKIVNDSAFSAGAKLATKLGLGKSQGGTTADEFIRDFNLGAEEDKEAGQVPTSNSMGIAGTEKYKNLVGKETFSARIKGVMSMLGGRNALAIVSTIDSDKFRKTWNIAEDNEDFNLMIKHSYKLAMKTERLNYTEDLSSFKNTLYTSTNRGDIVDIDKAINEVKNTGFAIVSPDGASRLVREDGFNISPKDEHKLRKQFKSENALVVSVDNYRDNLSKDKGSFDSTVGMKPKDKEALLIRVNSDILGITGESLLSGAAISGQLSQPEKALELTSYMQDGGELPKQVSTVLLNPTGSEPDKWSVNRAAVEAIGDSARSAGKPLTNFFDAAGLGKLRAMSNIESDISLTIEQKQEQLIAMGDDFTKINSRGYVKPMVGSMLDKEDMRSAAKDADWTSDDLSGSAQNFELISHYANMNERSGMSASESVKFAVQQFDGGHSQHENPDGTEIAIPIQHKNLNPTGLLMFAKGNADIAARIGAQNMTNFKGYRVDRQIGMRKAPEFNVSKEYILTYDGRDVIDARFKYDDYADYISKLTPEQQRKVNKKLNKSRRETIEDALEKRKKLNKAIGNGNPIKIQYGQFDFEFIE